jgi:transglutaminase-like putative cysteine protease
MSRTLATLMLAGFSAVASCGGGKDACGGACCEPASKPVIESRFLKPSDSRTFSVEYVGKVSDIPPGTKKLRVWLPVPEDSTVQGIRNLSFSQPPSFGSDLKYDNKIAYFEFDHPGASVDLTMRFDCTRKEIRADLDALKTDGMDDSGAFGVFRKPDTLVLVDEKIRALSEGIVKGKAGTLEKSRAIYDYVVSTMTYDKNHDGWGRGSTQHACDVGKGNCTDFHALFTSLCRAQGIASGFEIGLYLPYDRKSDEKPGGYHCWAAFRVPGKTWVPVDCSEAQRFPARKEFFFGGHTSNRVTLSVGRDILLDPPQAGGPLNYFINPYAEADDKPLKADKTWTYKDLE